MTFSSDSSPVRITPDKAIEPAGTTPQPVKEFQPYMNSGAGGSSQGLGTPSSQGPTPMNLVQNQYAAGTTPSMDAIQNQAKTMQDNLGTIGKQLQTPNLKLKRSQAHLLKISSLTPKATFDKREQKWALSLLP